MSISDLVPWSRGRKLPLAHHDEHPVMSLHRDLNKVFEEFYRSFDLVPFGEFEGGFGEMTPKIDMTESAKAITISAELPGIDEKDVEVTLSGDMVTIYAEKKEEKKEETKGHYRMERRYGVFNRVLPLPCEIDAERATALFKNGVLTLSLPKVEEEKKSVRTIPIKKA